MRGLNELRLWFGRVLSLCVSHGVMRFFVHLICLLILFVLPEVLVRLLDPANGEVPMEVYVKSAVYVGVFYISYFFIVDKALGHRHGILRFFGYSVALVAVATALLVAGWHSFGPGSRGVPEHEHVDGPPSFNRERGRGPALHIGVPHRHGPRKDVMSPPPAMIASDMAIVILTIMLGVALRLMGRWNNMEIARREIDAQRNVMELRQLKAQLNPHFLFNTLNAVYALVDISPLKARESIHRLSGMLRYVLYNNAPSVTLADEITFVKDYVNLMRLRLPASVPVRMDVDAGEWSLCPVAPLLLINVIENAFKHGLTGVAGHGIDIDITVKDGVLRCRVGNYYNPPLTGQEAERSGIGLKNMRRRFDLFYPGRHAITVEKGAERYVVTLEFDISAPPSAGAETKNDNEFTEKNN